MLIMRDVLTPASHSIQTPAPRTASQTPKLKPGLITFLPVFKKLVNSSEWCSKRTTSHNVAFKTYVEFTV